MTYDEDAAKVAEKVLAEFPGVWAGGFQRHIFATAIAAFGRRCAEAMREECAKVVDAEVKQQDEFSLRCCNVTDFEGEKRHKYTRYTLEGNAQAIRRVEVK